jgi:HAE1 family hydrophobic/amphiphilic exporter-1
VQNLRLGGRQSKSRYQYTLQSVKPGQLQEFSDKLMAKMRAEPIFRDVTSDSQQSGLEAQLTIDRDKANALGVQMHVRTRCTPRSASARCRRSTRRSTTTT